MDDRRRSTRRARALATAVAVWSSLAAAVAMASPSPSPSPSPAETVETARRLATFLWAILLLTVVFLTGLFVMRALQRARQRMMREPAAPTEYTDAWSLHRTPTDHDDDLPRQRNDGEG